MLTSYRLSQASNKLWHYLASPIGGILTGITIWLGWGYASAGLPYLIDQLATLGGYLYGIAFGLGFLLLAEQ